VKIQDSSIVHTKQKVPSLGSLIQAIRSKKPLKDVTPLSKLYNYKNFIPLPISLVQSLLSITNFDPDSVAQAFLSALESALESSLGNKIDSSDESSNEDDSKNSSTRNKKTLDYTDKDDEEEDENIDSPPMNSKELEDEEDTPITKTSGRIPRKQKPEKLVPIELLQDIAEFEIVFQFCFLCSKEKIKNLVYSVHQSLEILVWQSEIERKFLISGRDSNSLINTTSTSRRSNSIDDDDLTTVSNLSLKDKHMIHTLLKISENLYQNTLCLTKESEEKSKGFSKLENHKTRLLLNATESKNSEDSPSEPTEFCQSFLKKSTIFRAKETLQQAIKTHKEIVFYPSTAFTSKLFTVDLLWSSPDSPTGISLFYCAESLTQESDQGYALLDKIDRSDIQKVSKQILEIPKSYSSALWMLKNFRVVLNLYLGQNSPASKCLLSWIEHFENNRVNYQSLQQADPSFLTQVLFSIDRALQIYWLSCSENEDRRSVNTKNLLMQELQNNIERHNFHYILPKSIADKCLKTVEGSPIKFKETNLKRDPKDLDKDNYKKQRIEETQHKHWHIKRNKNYTDVFWKHTSKCPKTKSGKYICMKFFIKGHCVKNCNRSHRLAPEDEKVFEEFLKHCRASDFPVGAEEP
jgi:hypothetical protein